MDENVRLSAAATEQQAQRARQVVPGILPARIAIPSDLSRSTFKNELKEGTFLKSSESSQNLQEMDEALNNQSRQSWDIIYRNIYPGTFRYALYLYKDNDDAEDAAQHAMIITFKNTYRISHGKELAFAKAVVRTEFLSKYSKNKKTKKVIITEYTDEHEWIPSGENVEKIVLGKELSEMIDRCIAKLREDQKVVLILYHKEGLSYEEISAKLDIPMGTVKSRLRRARGCLRECLEESYLSEMSGGQEDGSTNAEFGDGNE
jgi:RNA polymerase sigma-70 factor, ECF subfamily